MCTGLETAAIGAASQLLQSRTQSKLLEREAALGKQAADFEEAQLRKRGVSLAASQRTAASKSGVTQSGSILDVMRESAEEVELQALNIQFGAEAAARARLFEAQQVGIAGGLGAINTVLSGLGGPR